MPEEKVKRQNSDEILDSENSSVVAWTFLTCLWSDILDKNGSLCIFLDTSEKVKCIMR